MIAFRLDKQIGCEEVCKKLQLMFQKMQGTDISNKMLTINIVDIAYTDNNLIPKIEYKDSNNVGIQTTNE